MEFFDFSEPDAFDNLFIENFLGSDAGDGPFNWIVVVVGGRFRTATGRASTDAQGCASFAFDPWRPPVEGPVHHDGPFLRVPEAGSVERLDLVIDMDPPVILPLREITIAGRWVENRVLAGWLEAKIPMEEAAGSWIGELGQSLCAFIGRDHGSLVDPADDCLHLPACILAELPEDGFDCAEARLPDTQVAGAPAWTLRALFEATPIVLDE